MGKQDEELRELQLIEFDILKKFKELCEKHNLTYYLIGGTLLGAVRHKGFIPWDDDVDVSMPRPDYVRFLEIAKEELVSPYVLDIRDHHAFPFARIDNTSKRVKSEVNLNVQIWYSWIDVFPMDAMPANQLRYSLRKLHIWFRQRMFLLSAFNDWLDRGKKRGFPKRVLIKLIDTIHLEHFLDSDKQLAKWHRVLASYPYEKGRYVGQLLGGYKFKYMMEREVYEPGKELEFEGELFHVPENYDALLRNLYGDYMTLPPEDKRDKHKSTILYD